MEMNHLIIDFYDVPPSPVLVYFFLGVSLCRILAID